MTTTPSSLVTSSEAARLTSRRVALKLSQRALARILNVHWTTVFRWEHDQRQVPRWIDLVLDTLEKDSGSMVSSLAWLQQMRDSKRGRKEEV